MRYFVLPLIGLGLLAWAFLTSYTAAVILTVFAIYLPALIGAAAAVLVSSAVFWLVLPGERRQYYRSHKTRLIVIVTMLLVFWVAVTWVANRMFLPHRLHPISVISDLLILFFTIAAGWSVLAHRLVARILIPGTPLLVVAIGVLSFIGSATRHPTGQGDLDKLTALPYLTWVPDKDAAERYGVVTYDKELACDGINFYNPRNLPTAYLMDMSGNILHTWSAAIDEDDTWVVVKLYPNGDLLALVEEKRLLKLDWNSHVIWVKDLRVHHDMAMAADGEVIVLSRKPYVYRFRGLPVMVIDDQITFLSASQEITRQISLNKLLGGWVQPGSYWKQYRWLTDPRNLAVAVGGLAKSPYDVPKDDVCDFFHSNTIEIIDRNIDDAFREGDLLFCARNLDLVGVVDPTTAKLLWTWGPGYLDRPHDPTLLDNGNILIFDNGTHRGFSRVVEVDPSTDRIVWEYRSTPPEDFFSVSRGGSQRLPNGNTLIAESDGGRVFEVTREGGLVWEYLNPERRELSRATIYRFARITDPENYPCLQRLERRQSMQTKVDGAPVRQN